MDDGGHRDNGWHKASHGKVSSSTLPFPNPPKKTTTFS